MVCCKDLIRNELTCVQGNNHPLLFSSELSTKNLFLLDETIPKDFEGTAKIRYRQHDQKCNISIGNNSLKIVFDEPQRSVTPGQSVVIYKDNQCLGGGGEINSIN